MPILDESVVETGAPRLHCAPSLGLRPSPQPSSATERRSLRSCGVDDPKGAPIETSGDAEKERRARRPAYESRLTARGETSGDACRFYALMNMFRLAFCL